MYWNKEKCGISLKYRTTIITLTLTCAALAADWPQYLGPNRNATSPEKGLLRSWPENGPEVLWTVTVGRGFGGPVVKDGKVYLLDRDDKVGDNLRCFDLSNGKELWNFAYDAPRRVMITASTRRGGGYGKVVGIDPFSGKILWEYAKWNCHIPVSSAVDAGDNKVLIVGGYELGATMIKVEKKADHSYGTTELFTTEEFGDQTKPPVLHNGYFYAQYGTNSRRDGLVCMSMDGQIMWKTRRSPDFNKGSMILVDGLILATDGAKTLYLIEPDPSGFKPLASADLLAEAGTGSENDRIASRVGGRTQNWAPLALSDGKLLMRDQTQLKCVKVAQ